MKKLISLTAGLTIGLTMSLTAVASNFYIGATGGLESNNYVSYVDTNTWNVNDSILATRAKVGYDFNNNIGLEIGGLLSRHISVESLLPSNVVTFNQQIVDSVAKLGFKSDNISLDGKAGLAYILRNNYQVNGEEARNPFNSMFTGVAGANLDYAILPCLNLDTEYMHYFKRQNFPGSDYVGLGVIYKF